MDELTPASGSPPHSPDIPQAGDDPDDPLRPEIEEENSVPEAPGANPTQDMEAAEDLPSADGNDDDIDDLSDNESVLSEVDEAQFEDFDPANIALDDRPAIAVDETNVGLIGVHKRKRAPDESAVDKKKKKKRETRREKPGRGPRAGRRGADDDDDFSGGEQIEGKRVRKKDGAERKDKARARKPSPENEEELTPEERRRRALDRAMDEALRNPNRRGGRKKDGIDLDAMADAEIEEMRRRMTEAAQADNDARAKGQIAMHKVRLLPEVVSLLNRNTLQNSLVDPDINLLEAVRFFLEPLNDGSLPAYNIQRELFAALARLPVSKDALVASGIGKVTLFYTKSNRPEPGIKRQAEKLLGEWTRPILKRSDDYRKREFVEANYDPTRLPLRPSQPSAAITNSQAAARERALAPPVRTNRARVEGGPTSYTIVPKTSLHIVQHTVARAPGASGEDAFRRMKARQMGKAGGGGGGARR